MRAGLRLRLKIAPFHKGARGDRIEGSLSRKDRVMMASLACSLSEKKRPAAHVQGCAAPAV